MVKEEAAELEKLRKESVKKVNDLNKEYVATESLDVTGPLTPWSRVSDEGNTNTRYSCTGCGNIIYGIGDTNPELAKLQAGTLDDTSDVEPDVHMWTRRKQPWVRLPEGASTFETQPEDAAGFFQAALDYRARRQGALS